jgi:hypothetical protein
MGRRLALALLGAATFVTGCAGVPDRYPVSRAAVSPGDPVQAMTAPLLPATLGFGN